MVNQLQVTELQKGRLKKWSGFNGKFSAIYQ